MVWHDTPRDKAVACSVKFEQRLLHDLGDFGVAQCATTGALIKPLGEAFSAVGIALGGGMAFEFCFQFGKRLRGQGIGEAECNGLEF